MGKRGACIGRMSVEDRDDRAFIYMILQKNLIARCTHPVTSSYNREHQMSHAEICRDGLNFAGAAGRELRVCMTKFITGALL